MLWCTCRSIRSYLKLTMYWWTNLIHIIPPLNEACVFLTNDPKNQSVPYTPVLRISSVWATIYPVQWAVLQFVTIILLTRLLLNTCISSNVCSVCMFIHFNTQKQIKPFWATRYITSEWKPRILKTLSVCTTREWCIGQTNQPKN